MHAANAMRFMEDYMVEPSSGEERPRPILEPVPEEWNARLMQAEVDFPVERSEVLGTDNSLKARIVYVLVRGMEQTLGRLPCAVLDPFLGVLARIATRFDRRHTQAAEAYIRAAFPDAKPAEVRSLMLGAWRHFANISLRASHLSGLLGQPLGEHFEVRMSPEAREVIESDQGCVLVSAHVGNWEAIGYACQALGVVPFYGVSKAPRNGFLARHMQTTREACGLRMIPRKGAMTSAPKVLRAGGSVMMLLDHRARLKPVWAKLFGRPAGCDRSAGVLLRRIGAPILFFGCYEQAQGPRFRLDLGTVTRPSDLAGLAPEVIARRINVELEHLILAQPDQYFWLHDRFKDAPDTLPDK
ncbi:MAG: KDO2-lipid IV(A) lauroyltransferase [Planctomycetota bacterium]|jgi:KDO2-lipid IV(A) lauroyltransferase